MIVRLVSFVLLALSACTAPRSPVAYSSRSAPRYLLSTGRSASGCLDTQIRHEASALDTYLASQPTVVTGWKHRYGDLLDEALLRRGDAPHGTPVVCFLWESQGGVRTWTALITPRDVTIVNAWRPGSKSEWWSDHFKFARIASRSAQR